MKVIKTETYHIELTANEAYTLRLILDFTQRSDTEPLPVDASDRSAMDDLFNALPSNFPT